MSKLQILAQQAGKLLKEKKATISVVETATGGTIAASLLAVPGASQFFAGGINAYSLKAREVFLGWTDEDNAGYAGPTQAIVLKLAKSLQGSLETTYCIAESGAAGPTLPAKYRAEIKAPGYCPLAVVGPNGLEKAITVETGLSDRSDNMQRFSEEALQLLISVLTADQGKL